MDRRRLWSTSAMFVTVLFVGLALIVFAKPGGATGPGWEFPNGVPGNPVSVSSITTELAQYSSVDPLTIRSVSSAGGFTFLAGARGADICFAAEEGSYSLGFECLDDLLATQPQRAFVMRTHISGPEGQPGNDVKLAGITRDDVAEIKIKLTTGGTTVLPLNSFRGFAYATGSSPAMPTSLTAYNSSGQVLETMPIDRAPPEQLTL